MTRVSTILLCLLLISVPLNAGVDGMSHGQADILWRNRVTGQNSLWHMSSADRMSRESLPSVSDQDWVVQGMADFDQDSEMDILFRHVTRGENRVWLMDGGTRSSSVAITGAHRNWALMSVGDYDGDGDPDLMWRNTTNGANRFWEMDGLRRVSSLAVRTVALTGWQMVGSGDLDGDGNDDLVWRNASSSTTRVWLMDKENLLSSGSLPAVPEAWQISGVGDFDADGRADLLWHNTVTGANTIWIMAGLTRLSRASIPSTDLAWLPAGVGDYDGDGKADILWRNQSDGQNRLWLMDGSLRRSSLAVLRVSDPNWEIVGWGDVDGSSSPIQSGDPNFIVRDFRIPEPLFLANSAWRQSAATAQVQPNSNQIIQTTYRVMRGDITDQVPAGEVTPFNWPFIILNFSEFTVPIFRANNQLTSLLLCDYDGVRSWPGAKFSDTTFTEPGGPINMATPVGPIRPSDPPGSFSDGHLVLYNPESQIEYDYWQATTQSDGDCLSKGGGLVGTTLNQAGAADFFDTSTTGVSADGQFSARASGVALLAGLIIPEDFENGIIEHALAFAIPGPRNLSPDPEVLDPSEYVYPASVTETDFFSTNSNAMVTGTRIRLKNSIVDEEGITINESIFTPATAMLLTALRDYGAYLIDNAGGFVFYTEDIHSGFLNATDDQVNQLIGAAQGTSLTPGKTRWQIVMDKVAEDLDLVPIPIAAGPWVDGQDASTAQVQSYNFEVIDNATKPPE